MNMLTFLKSQSVGGFEEEKNFSLQEFFQACPQEPLLPTQPVKYKLMLICIICTGTSNRSFFMCTCCFFKKKSQPVGTFQYETKNYPRLKFIQARPRESLFP